MLAALAQDFGDMEEFYYDVPNYPIAYDPGTLRDMEIEEQLLRGDNALFLTDEKVDAATSTDLPLLGSWNMRDDPPVPSQDIFASWIDGDSIDGWNDIATASTLQDTYAPTSDPYDSSVPVDTGHLIAISPFAYLGDILNPPSFPLPDLMTIFKEKCPPIREGDRLTPLCCTGDRVGQTVSQCSPYDIANWNCYFHRYQYCCRLFISDSQQGVNCLKGFA
jgi:hypothetical protein